MCKGGWFVTAGLLAFKLPTSTCFLASLHWIASRDFLVPRRVERPGPGFAHRAADHGWEGARLGDSTEGAVNGDSAEANQNRNIEQHEARGDRRKHDASK